MGPTPHRAKKALNKWRMSGRWSAGPLYSKCSVIWLWKFNAFWYSAFVRALFGLVHSDIPLNLTSVWAVSCETHYRARARTGTGKRAQLLSSRLGAFSDNFAAGHRRQWNKHNYFTLCSLTAYSCGLQFAYELTSQH